MHGRHKLPNNTLSDHPRPVVSSVPVANGQSPPRAIGKGAIRRPAFEPHHPAWYPKAALTEPTPHCHKENRHEKDTRTCIVRIGTYHHCNRVGPGQLRRNLEGKRREEQV